MTNNISVRRAVTRDDFYRVAALHKKCLNKGYLSTFGERVIAALYRSVSESGGGVVLIAVDGTRCIGFVAGTWDLKRVYRWYLLHHPAECCVAAWSILFSYTRFKKSLQTIRYSQKDAGVRAELISIGVDSERRCEGIGALLYREMIRECKERNICKFYITVGETLVSAHEFYRRMGAEQVGVVRVHHDTVSILYRQMIQL